MRTALLSVVTLVIVGCGGSGDDNVKTTQQKLVWSCASVRVQNGTSLDCTSSDGVTGSTSDGTSSAVVANSGWMPFGATSSAPIGSTTATSGGSGSSANVPTSGSTTGTGGAAAGSGASSSDGVSSGGGSFGAGSSTIGIVVGDYFCVAGGAYCPPSHAIPGVNESVIVVGGVESSGSEPVGSSTATGGGSGGTASGGSTSGGGDAKDLEKPDKDSNVGSGSATGGGSSATGSSDGVAGGSGGTSGAPVGSGVVGIGPESDSYHCTFDGETRKCRRATPTCDAGKTPIPGGQCGSPTSGSSDGSGGAPTGGSGSGGALSGGGETTVTSNQKSVTFDGSRTNADGTTTWVYTVNELPGGQDLSNWVLGTNCPVIGGSPKLEYVHPDPNAGITGVKWGTGAGFSSGQFSVTVGGNATAGVVPLATKAPGEALGQTTGPVCR